MSDDPDDGDGAFDATGGRARTRSSKVTRDRLAACQTPSDARPIAPLRDSVAARRLSWCDYGGRAIYAGRIGDWGRRVGDARQMRCSERTNGRTDGREGGRPGGEREPRDARRHSLLALVALRLLARGGQLSRTKWLFAVNSLERGPGDGARVRSSRTRRRRRGHARDSRPIRRPFVSSGRARRAAPRRAVVLLRVPRHTPLVTTPLFEIFAHTRARTQIKRRAVAQMARRAPVSHDLFVNRQR